MFMDATVTLFPRFAASALMDELADSTVVLIHGPRQNGKTALVKTVGESRGCSYFTVDDAVALAAATTNPVGFIADLPDRSILNKVQRVPALFTAIKSAVDRAEIEAADWSLTPGRYVGIAPPEEDEDFDFELTLRDIHTELADHNREAAELAAKIQDGFSELGI